MKIEVGTLASSFGTVAMDTGHWVSLSAGKAVRWLTAKVAQAGQLLRNIRDGGIELFNAIRQGKWDLIRGWFTDDPIGAAAGVGAVGLAALVVGGTVVGWVGAGVASVASAIGGTGILGGIVLSNVAPQLISGMVRAAEAVYHFNWQESDQELLDQINNSINSLGGPVGEFLGRSVATLLVGSVVKTPILEIKVRPMAMAIIINPQVKDRLLDAMADLMATVKQTALFILAKKIYVQTRQWIRENVRTGLPELDSFIEKWGTQEGSSLALNEKVDETVKLIPNEFARNAVSQGLEAFFTTFGDLLIEDSEQIRFV